jgi:hypothetical protein
MPRRSLVLNGTLARRAGGDTATGPLNADESQVCEVVLPADGKSVLISDLTRTK